MERRMMIKGVLFDFDGTLTSPGALDFPAIKRTLGCPSDQPILEYLDTVSPTRRAELLKGLEELEDRAAENSHPNEGAERVIATLKASGIVMGILTRNSLKSVKKALQKFRGVRAHDFAAIVTRDESLPKPHPDGVHKAATLMNVSTKELLVVGDFRFDVISGNRAGARTVLLANGEASEMRPGDPKPDYTVNTLVEILQLLETHGAFLIPPGRAMSAREK
jgi:HAD superfamily hydrolase (TIGR01509 family)